MDAASGDAIRMAEQEWYSVYKQVDRSQARTIIISAEGFFPRKFDNISGVRLHERLKAMHYEQLRVLCYLRSPTSYFLSEAQQKLKGGFGLIQPVPLRRIEKIKSYREFLGVDMEARVFERDQLVHGDAVRDFLDWIKCPEQILTKQIEEFNMSVSAEAMDVLQQFSSCLDIRNESNLKEQRRLVKLVKRFDSIIENPTKPALYPAVKDHILAINTDLSELRDHYGVTFSDVDYTQIDKLHGKPQRNIEIQNVRDICPLDAERSAELKGKIEAEMKKTGSKKSVGTNRPNILRGRSS